MTIARTNAVSFNARIDVRRVPSRTPETYGTEIRERADLSARLTVDDAQLAKSAPGFDGMERPFVLVPAEHEGQVTWYRHELRHAGQQQGGFMTTATQDVYELPEIRNVDRAAVSKYGVALGMETNVGTVWAQEPGRNARVDLWK